MKLPFLRAQGSRLAYLTSLDAPLLHLSDKPEDGWDLRSAFEHTLITGGTGSAKTSSSGAAIANAFLRAGFGALVLCVKTDEPDRWEAYAHACGRTPSVIRFEAGGHYRFNFIDYLMSLPPESGGGLADNVVDALMVAIEEGNSDE
jgi:hypothetical protein